MRMEITIKNLEIKIINNSTKCNMSEISITLNKFYKISPPLVFKSKTLAPNRGISNVLNHRFNWEV